MNSKPLHSIFLCQIVTFLLIVLISNLGISQNYIKLIRCDAKDASLIRATYEDIKIMLEKPTDGLTRLDGNSEESNKSILVQDGYYYYGPTFSNSENPFHKNKTLKSRIGREKVNTMVEGTILWKNWKFFRGTFLNEKPYNGLIVFDKDTYYIGELSFESPNGQGKKIEQGLAIEGIWRNGQIDDKDIQKKWAINDSERLWNEPNTSCNTAKELVKNLIMSRSMKDLLYDKSLRPDAVDFAQVFVNMNNKHDDYRTNLSNHINNFAEDDFKKYKKFPDINCISAKEILQSWKLRQSITPPPTFKNLDDVFITCSFYNSETLEKYDIYFYKSPISQKIFIIQLQLYRL